LQTTELEANVDDEFGRIVTLTLIPTIHVLQNNKGLKVFLDNQLLYWKVGSSEPCFLQCTNLKEADSVFEAVKKKYMTKYSLHIVY
jgi:hypothetical protein